MFARSKRSRRKWRNLRGLILFKSSSFLETFRSTKRMGPTEKKDAAGISENFEVAPEESVSSISEMAAQERPQARLIGDDELFRTVFRRIPRPNAPAEGVAFPLLTSIRPSEASEIRSQASSRTSGSRSSATSSRRSRTTNGSSCTAKTGTTYYSALEDLPENCEAGTDHNQSVRSLSVPDLWDRTEGVYDQDSGQDGYSMQYVMLKQSEQLKRTGNTFFSSLFSLVNGNRDKRYDDEDFKLESTTLIVRDWTTTQPSHSYQTRRLKIAPDKISGKPHIRFATDENSGQKYLLKLYNNESLLQADLGFHRSFTSQHVPKLLTCTAWDENALDCLIFECGDFTLTEWIQRGHPNALAQRAVLYEILEGICDLHRQDLIHGDLKPSNIMWFSSDCSWKLLDVDNAVYHGKSTSIEYTLSYASPEIVRAERHGKTKVYMHFSSDMFSFGIIAFEVLTGSRFYGAGAQPEFIQRCLRGKEPFPGVERVASKQTQRFIKRLLQPDPDSRPSAVEALTSKVFRMEEPCGVDNGGIDAIHCALSRLLQLIELNLNERRAANIVTEFCLEFMHDKRSARDTLLAQLAKVPTMVDDYLPEDPVFLLKVRSDYRLCITLNKEHRLPVPIQRVQSVKISAPGGDLISLDIVEECVDDKKHEVIARLCPSKLGSQRVSQVSPCIGELHEKMVSHRSLLIYPRIVAAMKACSRIMPQRFREGTRSSISFAKLVAGV